MTAPKRIAIIGTGSMGSVYAALLASAGHDVWAVDAWAEHVAAMRAHGLRVEGKSGDRTVRLNATTEAGDVGEADLVIMHPVAGLAHAALDHIGDAKLPANSTDVDGLALEGEGRIPRDDEQ